MSLKTDRPYVHIHQIISISPLITDTQTNYWAGKWLFLNSIHNACLSYFLAGRMERSRYGPIETGPPEGFGQRNQKFGSGFDAFLHVCQLFLEISFCKLVTSQWNF